MNRNHYLFACLATLVLVGCSGETKLPEATGEGRVRAINAISTSPQITFMIEERAIAAVEYKTASTTSTYDDLTYTFNFEALLPQDPADPEPCGPCRLASQVLDIVRDTSYTFVIHGALATPTITVWERPIAEFAEGATNFEVQFGHLAGTMGDFDVYFNDPIIAPVLGNEIGTLTMLQLLPPTSLEAGDYKLTLTAVGDPSTVLFESDTISPGATTSLLFSTFDTDANDLAPVAVRAFNLAAGATIPIADVNYPPTIRFFHTNAEIGATDIYVEEPIDDPMVLPLVENHMFRDITADFEIPTSPVPLTYTAAGNIGTIHIDSDRPLTPGTRNYYYLIQSQLDENVFMTDVPDHRSIETLVRMSLLNTAAIDVLLDIYIVPRDVLIDEINPLLVGVPVALAPLPVTLIEGAFDLHVTANGEKVSMAGPIPLDVVSGDVIDLIIYEDITDPTKVDVEVFTFP